MKSFRVKWEIDVDATDVRNAAREALRIQRDLNSQALCFDVTDGESYPYNTLSLWIMVDLRE